MGFKYGSQKHEGFPSKLEWSVHQKLLERQSLGEISEVKRQQTIILQSGNRETRITWRLDFSFVKDGILWCAEAKGFPTDVYKLKLKLWRKIKPHPLEIWKGNWRNPKLSEVIK